MNTLQIYPSRRNQLGVLAVGVIFLAGGMWLLSHGNLTTKATLAGWLGVIFGGGTIVLTGIMLIKSLVHRQPLLQLDERGLTFISIQGRGKLIPWSDIAGFGDYRIHSQQFITVIISDPEQPLKEVSAIQRRTIAISLRLTGAPYSICPSTLAYPRNKLRSTLQEYHTKFR